jgi:hypothetical protein
MRGRGERRLDDALKAVASTFRSLRAPWMVIGGIAVIARGVRRMTTDIDVVVRGDSVDVTLLLRKLARFGLEPRIDDAEAFAEENLVLLLRHVPSGVDVDLSLGWTTFEQEAIAASTRAAYGPASFPMARAEDLLVFKTMAARPKDIEDAAALILMHPMVDLTRVRRRLAELAAIADEPALIDGLEQVIRHARTVRNAASGRESTAGRRRKAGRIKRRMKK